MQNRNPNIDERLQILNDYIQRTIDALNMTRQVAQGLSSSYQTTGVGVQSPVGLSHTGIVPQFVQTPYGLVAINQLQPQLGVPQTLGMNYGIGYGLSHSHLVLQQLVSQQLVPQQISPQFSTLGTQMAPMGFGFPQVGLPQVSGFNYGMSGNLNHSAFVPQWPVSVSQWPVSVGQPVNFGQPVSVGQLGVPQFSQFSQFSPVTSQWPMNNVQGVI
jgi:hypothetical protein